MMALIIAALQLFRWFDPRSNFYGGTRTEIKNALTLVVVFALTG